MLRLIEEIICKMGFIYCADITVAWMCVSFFLVLFVISPQFKFSLNKLLMVM